MSKATREASHAGSWYAAEAKILSAQLKAWMEAGTQNTDHQLCASARHPRAIIGPHAGYRYSGAAAGYSYIHLARASPNIRRIFVLGPSHHVYLAGCALPTVTTYQTPLGVLRVDTVLVQELLQNHGSKAAPDAFRDDDKCLFHRMSKSVDEEEHSLEMQLPFIFAAMSGSTQPYVIVPVMVGQLGKTLGPRIGQVLGPYLDDPSNFFVISSDFCHWGKRFSYQPYDSQAIKKGTPLWTGIEQLDREGMANILTQDPNTFTQYIKRTGNTICGKNPILVLLHAIQYAQHKNVHRDSSVSYAAGVLVHHLEVQSGALPTLAQMPPMLDDSKNDDDDSSE